MRHRRDVAVTWLQVHLSPVVAIGYLCCTAILLLMGGQALPVPMISELADTRLVYFAGALYGCMAALSAGVKGPFWPGWSRWRVAWSRGLWAIFLLAASMVPAFGLLSAVTDSATGLIPVLTVPWALALARLHARICHSSRWSWG